MQMNFGLDNIVTAEIEKGLKIYPNPFDEYLEINMESYILDNPTINIYNINGVIINQQKFEGFYQTLHLTNLPKVAGVYFIEIQDKNIRLSKKIVYLGVN